MYTFDYIYTGRESVQHGPAGVKVTNTLTGNSVKCTEFNKVIENMTNALKRLEKLDNPSPKKVVFKHYLHDDEFSSLQWSLGQVGVKLTDELYDKVGKPFYEVTLTCELDLETGEVTILEADL